MGDNENQQTSAKTVGNEKFSDPKWRKLFANYTAYKELFEQNGQLTELFEPYPEWAEAFASNPRWFEFLGVDIKVAEFFRHQPIGGQQVQFWSEHGWFDRIAKKLTKDEIPKWIKQFEENGELTELFKEKPAWALLYALEPEAKALFEKNNVLFAAFILNPKWAEVFASNPRWVVFLDNDIEVAKFFRYQPTGNQQVQFWHNQGWFDRIAKKLEKAEISEWIKQFEEKGELNTLFKDMPEWALLYALEPEAKELKLKERFDSNPKWTETFASNPRWFEFLDVNIKPEEFFKRQQPAEFWSEQGWFDRIAKKLTTKNAILEWYKRFPEKDEWNKSFDDRPEWALLNALEDKASAFKRNANLEKLFDRPEWAALFFDNSEWIVLFGRNNDAANFFAERMDWAELFFPYPKWVDIFDGKNLGELNEIFDEGRLGKSLKNKDWLKLLARKPELFSNKRECFERIANKLINSDGQQNPKGQTWIKQCANDKVWVKTFDDTPEWALVYVLEIEKINERRHLDKTSNDNKNLVGLAFSGGGIRSASFGLGVLEALRDFGLLKKIDYLSTVSGGGYIGAWLSANCKRAAEEEIDWLTPGEIEEDKKKLKKNWDDSISHLRRFSNYLSPKVGLFSADTWTMATIWLRNTLLIQLMIGFCIASILLIPRMTFTYLFEWFPDQFYGFFCNLTASVLCAWGVAGIAGNNLHILKDEFFKEKEI